MNQYSEKLRRSMSAKILIPGGPSVLSLSRETGISPASLSRWVRKYKGNGALFMTGGQRRPQDWSGSERFEAILATNNLKGAELGVYLRKNGLTSAHLERWKQEFINIVDSGHGKVGRKPKNQMEKALQKENKALKRDLRRKDKALAETSALLILKKKAREIWGIPEDEK